MVEDRVALRFARDVAVFPAKRALFNRKTGSLRFAAGESRKNCGKNTRVDRFEACQPRNSPGRKKKTGTRRLAGQKCAGDEIASFFDFDPVIFRASPRPRARLVRNALARRFEARRRSVRATGACTRHKARFYTRPHKIVPVGGAGARGRGGRANKAWSRKRQRSKFRRCDPVVPRPRLAFGLRAQPPPLSLTHKDRIGPSINANFPKFANSGNDRLFFHALADTRNCAFNSNCCRC